MKRKIFIKCRKSLSSVLLISAVGLALSSCLEDLKDLGPLDVTMSGEISHTDHTPGQSATVTFTRFPANKSEFNTIREQIGHEPQGAVALQLMAFEMYRRNKTTGEKCIRLNTTSTGVTDMLSRLKELFSKDSYYARPYQIAAFLKGATPENGYSPQKPYTVEIEVSNAIEYQYSNDYQTNALCLRVLTKGKDKGAEEVVVLKTAKPGETSNGSYFIVFNCPGLYAQVKQPSFTSPFKGLD